MLFEELPLAEVQQGQLSVVLVVSVAGSPEERFKWDSLHPLFEQDMTTAGAKMRKPGGGGFSISTFPLILLFVYIGYKMGVVSYAVLILAVCMTISMTIMSIALYEPEKNEDGTVRKGVFELLINAMSGKAKYDDDSMSDLVNSFQTDAKDVNDSYLLLNTLKKKLRKSQPSLQEAASMGLVKTAVNFVKDACTDDKRIIPALDVVNTVLSNANACSIVRGNEAEAKEVVESLVMGIKRHMRPIDEIDLSGGKVSETEAKTDALLSGDPHATSASEVDDDEDVDFDFSDKVTKKPLNKYFYAYGSKMLMSLGLLAADDTKLQTIIGDKGAIKVVVNCMLSGVDDANVIKWSSWAVINFVYEHPPNKREFFQKDGLDHVIAGAKRHATAPDVFSQCVALLLAMIAYDQHTKMNQSAARQRCLASGVFEVLQEGKKHAPDHQELHNMIDQVLKLLISDWS